jgi:transposase-like protein
MTMGWYLRFSLSARKCRRTPGRARPGNRSRDGVELGAEIRVGTGTAAGAHLKPTTKSWHVDETYVRVKGEVVLPLSGRGFDGTTIDFLFPAIRDALPNGRNA